LDSAPVAIFGFFSRKTQGITNYSYVPCKKSLTTWPHVVFALNISEIKENEDKLCSKY
jgi:hypothetical protein